jgi:ATP-dependent helicase/nuclease subunit B
VSAGPPGLFTIAPGRAFLSDLAEGIVARFGNADDPLALAAVTVFLPTRRAARTLAERLTAASGREALVLPRIVTLGDVDEDEGIIDPAADLGPLPPEIPRLQREMILAERVAVFRRAAGSAGGFAVSLALARALARSIDEAANEDAVLTDIAGLVPADLAQHWEATIAFLSVITSEWPEILKRRGRLDPAARRSLLIRAYAARLERERPTAPFIVAGSSGSINATGDLMRVIAGLPSGAVVLDGLDTGLDEDSWAVLPPSHPQFALKELLERLGATRAMAGPWRGSPAAASPRAALLSEAMRPPETADRWSARGAVAALAAGVAGLTLIEAANEREEALAVALAIRETLETKDATAALVTPDRMLARRVAAELRRWDIPADDSAGLPLAKTEAGALLGLALAAAESGGAPVELLALLKHPRVALGGARGDVLRTARALERKVLRPARVAGGFAEARARIGELDAKGEAKLRLKADERRAISGLLATLEDALSPLAALATGTHALERLVAAHVAVLERLTDAEASPRIGAWASADGEAAFALMQEMAEAASGAGIALSLADYAIALDGAARAAAVRPQGPRHPRVAIWGPLEARMHDADLMILGGLNEGVWPANPADDPWLSRPMRTALKLSAPERRIGLAAHDFAIMAAQPRVLLTRARRKDGAPSNPSRFLLRLAALAEGSGAPIPEDKRLDLARRLDETGRPKPAPRPMPRPPLAARPRSLSVTRIETWVRDPYAIYAEQVLRLKKLDDLAQQLGARDRGMMIHAAVELFAERSDWTGDAYATLLDCGVQAFGPALDEPDVRAFWWPRFQRAARWLATQETAWRADRVASVVEKKQSHHFADVDFHLTGQPDRIDRLSGGGIRVIDYKTGGVPSKKQVESFMAPQLPLLAAMARAGAFGADVQGPPAELVYAQLGGGKTAGSLTELPDPLALTDELERRLKQQVRRFDDIATPYPPRVAVEKLRYGGDYDHLSRFDEWGEAGEAES